MTADELRTHYTRAIKIIPAEKEKRRWGWSRWSRAR